MLSTGLTSTLVTVMGRTYRVFGYEGEGWFELLRKAGAFGEPHLADLANYVREDAVCLDVGANLGLYTLALSAMCPKGRVVAFEPDAPTFSALERTIEANGCKNVATLPTVVGNGGDCGTFVEDPDWRSSSHFVPGPGGTVAIGIDALNYGRVDVIKIDAEGSELDILEGALETIRRCRPVVIAEFNSFAFVFYRNITPRDALDRIFGMFPRVSYYDRNAGGELKPLVDREKFLRENLLGGFVDNLVLTVGP